MNNWYKKAAAFGTDPFGSSELSNRVRYDDFEAGGDVAHGQFQPSDSNRNHSPNDYFSEADHSNLTEEQLEEIRKKKLKKKKLLKNKIKKELKQNSSNWYSLEKNAQFGVLDPLLPLFNFDTWTTDTYKKIKNIQNKKKSKKNIKKEDSNINSTKALPINEKIAIIHSSKINNLNNIKIGNNILKGSLLISKNGLSAIAFKESIKFYNIDSDFFDFGDNLEIPIETIKYWARENNIICKI